jgi:hypothetical protein
MKCRICGCTDEMGCPGGCSWDEADGADLCTICSEMRAVVISYIELCHAVTAASLARLLKEALAYEEPVKKRRKKVRKPIDL